MARRPERGARKAGHARTPAIMRARNAFRIRQQRRSMVAPAGPREQNSIVSFRGCGMAAARLWAPLGAEPADSVVPCPAGEFLVQCVQDRTVSGQGGGEG